MGPFLVVKPNISYQVLARLPDALVVSRIDLLPLDRPPQPFHKDIVRAPPAATHADPNAAVLEPLGKGQTRELGSLIGIEDCRLTMPERLLQGLHTKRATSMVIDTAQDSIYRLNQSITATKYINPPARRT